MKHLCIMIFLLVAFLSAAEKDPRDFMPHVDFGMRLPEDQRRLYFALLRQIRWRFDELVHKDDNFRAANEVVLDCILRGGDVLGSMEQAVSVAENDARFRVNSAMEEEIAVLKARFVAGLK